MEYIKPQQFGNADTARLLGMIAALGGEVFVLKAQVESLLRALKATGLLSDAQLRAAHESPDLAQWMGEEEKAFGRALMRPFVHPDEAPDVSPRMMER
jgi:hypothetical protein